MFAAILGGPEVIIIAVVLLVLFGAKKLPDLARSLGVAAKELRKGLRESEEDREEDSEERS